MYLDFFGLRELPFELTPNPRDLDLTPRHLEALSNLQYGLTASKAVTVLIGEAGTGKTTLLKAALTSDRCRHVRYVCLNNPVLTRGDFLLTLARSLGLSADAGQSKALLLEELESALQEARSQGKVTAVVVDEAQSLSTELLEEIRLLANIETDAVKLLPLVLVGQPELGRRLEDRELRQLKQRVALRCEVTPFNLPETATYVAYRIDKAGGCPIGCSRERQSLEFMRFLAEFLERSTSSATTRSSVVLPWVGNPLARTLWPRCVVTFRSVKRYHMGERPDSDRWRSRRLRAMLVRLIGTTGTGSSAHSTTVSPPSAGSGFSVRGFDIRRSH